MNEALCPGCSQRLKPEWVRCPRCRLWLGEQEKKPAAPARASSTSVVVAAPQSTPLGPWVFAAILVVAIGAGIAYLVNAGANTPPTGTAPVTLRGQTPVDPFPAPESRPIDPAVLTKNVTSDKLRAGHAAYMQGDFNKALAQFEDALAESPNDPDAHNNLAQVLVRQARVQEAMAHYDDAIRLDPTRWAFRFNRARAYGLLNRLPEAVAEYQIATQLFPEDYATHYNLGLTLMQLRRYPEAVTSLEQAVNLAPGEPSFLISLGTALVGAQEPEKARAVFVRFLEEAPTDPEVPRVKALITSMDAAAAR